MGLDHTITHMFGQRRYSILAAHDHGNDHDALPAEPISDVVAGRLSEIDPDDAGSYAARQCRPGPGGCRAFAHVAAPPFQRRFS